MHHVARARIPSFVSLVTAHREAAEAPNLDPIALRKRLRHAGKNLIDQQLRTSPGKLELVGDHRDKISLGHALVLAM